MKNKLAERIKELRLENGLTQKQLAKVIHVKKSAIGNYENYLRTPSLDLIILLADFFDCSIDYLVGRVDL